MSIGPHILEIQHFQNVTLQMKGQGHGWGHSSKSQCGCNILFIDSHSFRSIDSHSFRSMSIGPPIPEIQHFQNLTLEINGQGHGSGVPCQSGLELWLFQNLILKIRGQGHGWGHSSKSQCGSSILLNHTPFVPCQWALPFLRYSIFKMWPCKSRVKVMREDTVQSHNIGLISYRLTSLSFHVNRPSHSWDTAFSKFDLENHGLRSNDLMLHNYRSRQFHRTSNGINPSSGFKDMGSAKSGPSAARFDKFWPMGKPIWGKWAHKYDSAQLHV